MVAPITGPIAETLSNTVDGPGSLYWSRTLYRQKKPYNLPLAYKANRVSVINASKANVSTYLGYAKANQSRSNWQCGCPPAPLTNQYAVQKALADSLAREAFRNALGDKSAWLVNLAEASQSINMISTRANQLFKAAMLLRRGQVTLFAKHLQASLHPTSSKKHKHASKRSFADTWLEYHFGWAPLVADIYNSIDVLQRDFPYGQIEAKGRKVKVDDPYYSKSDGPYGTEIISGRCQGYIRTYCGADVIVTNPNLWLANNLGLVNPATVAWEVVPFSFVVDWFTTAESFLEQYTDFLGLSISNPWSTTKCELTGEAHYYFKPKPSGAVQKVDAYFVGNYIDRTLSIPSVNLGRRQVNRLSIDRALTAMSLLVQKGLKGKFS